MKPRKQRLVIERTAYADSYLDRPGAHDQWRITTENPRTMSVTVNTQEEVLLHVRAHMARQLEDEGQS